MKGLQFSLASLHLAVLLVVVVLYTFWIDFDKSVLVLALWQVAAVELGLYFRSWKLGIAASALLAGLWLDWYAPMSFRDWAMPYRYVINRLPC